MSNYEIPSTTGNVPSDVATSYVTNNGTAVPAANILNVLGLGELETFGSGNTVSILEPRSAHLIVDPTQYYGTHQTISAAMAAAVSGQTIAIRPGTYTENVTLTPGVNLSAFGIDGLDPHVTIHGTCTLSGAGAITMTGICLSSNGAPALAVTGSAASIVNLYGCNILANGSDIAINYTSSSATSGINIYNSIGNISSSTAQFYSCVGNGGDITFNNCTISNSGNSTVQSTNSANSVNFNWCTIKFPIKCTGSSGLGCQWSNMDCSGLATTAMTYNGTTQGNHYFSQFQGGSATPVIVGVGATCQLYHSTIDTTNTNAASGAGTLVFPFCFFANSGKVIATTGQSLGQGQSCNFITTTPGAYPYTAVAQDNVILADTSSAAVTINLTTPASGSGQWFYIKDLYGNAAANNITITPSAGTIDGGASYIINTNYGCVKVMHTNVSGKAWTII